MKCLCCGKEFTPKASIEEVECGWHKKCVKAFFGSNKLPLLDLSEEALKRLAEESTNKGYACQLSNGLYFQASNGRI